MNYRDTVRPELTEESEALHRLRSLSTREREVITGICNGRSMREIAASLGLAISTADNHRSSAYRKLNVHSAVQLMLWAFEVGLIETAAAKQRQFDSLAIRTLRT